MRVLSVAAIAAIVSLLPGRVSRAQPIPKAQTVKIDALFAAYDRTNSPGCAVGVYRDGQLVFGRGYGMANLEHGIALSTNTVFDIGSTSKQFTATAILLLAQDGKLSLDDEVQKHLPRLPRYQKPITIRHLLNHTSGVRDYLTLMSLHGTDFDGVTTDDDAWDLIVRQKAVNFTPGSEYLYSNSGYFLLSLIVKQVSGKTLAQFARERVFEPLGMTHTHIHDAHTQIVPNRATGYSLLNGVFAIDMSLFEQTGDGAVYTTVEDLLRWDRNFYTPTVGGRQLLDSLHTVGILANGDRLTYAMGLMVDQYRGLKRVRHGGAWAGYRAELLRFPEANTAVACLCNLGSANPSNLADGVAGVLLQDRFSAPATAEGTTTSAARSMTLPDAALGIFAGSYRDTATNEVRRLTIRDGAIASSRTPSLFRPVDSATFELPGIASLVFERDRAGQVTWMTERVMASAPRRYQRFTPIKLARASLDEYVGEYFAEEVNNTFKVEADSAGLIVTIAKDQKLAVAPTVRDVFTTGGAYSVAFYRNGKGRIAGFALGAGRVLGIRAVRKPSP